MLFGRRRHAAARTEPVARSAPRIDEDHIYEAVHEVAARLLGGSGQWTVAPRSDSDTDQLFHDVLAEGLTRSITAAVSEVLHRDIHAAQGDAAAAAHAGGSNSAGSRSAAEQAHESDDSPAALGWAPAPITTWADLRRPVTDEIPVPSPAGHSAA